MTSRFEPSRRADTDTPEPAPAIPKPVPRPVPLSDEECDRLLAHANEVRRVRFGKAPIRRTS